MKRIGFLLILTFLLTGCINNEKNSSVNEISVSILPQEYFVKQIAGDRFKINVMIPPGSSPATYEPTPLQLSSLSKTKLYLKMGYTAFELAWMEKLASANIEMTIADLSEGIELISENEGDHEKELESDHHHHGIDPHIWLSPMNVKGICENIYEALAEMYPEHKDEFSTNLIIFEGKLDSLDQYIKASLEDLDSRSFFTYHPALSYFARDYKLEQYPIELGGKEPSPAHLKKLVDLGKQNHIRLIFLQMQFDQRNAEVLANEIDAEIVQINPLDIEWFEQMMLITNKLQSNLN